jgi:ParB/RepB/Spo0J family partition protein
VTITALAVEHEPLLRRLAGDNPPSFKELADAIGRDDSNTHKTVKRLRGEGLIAGDALALTHRGEMALHGIDYAAGRFTTGAGREIAVRLDELAPHPANPRHMVDDERVATLAEAIATAGEVMHPLIVTPPDEAGQRYILAGQRRWLATTMLTEDGRWSLDRTLPAIEQAVEDDAAVIMAGLLENTGEPLSEIDEARALKALCDQYGWTATEAARKTGRLIRTVQHRLQILSKADPADLEAVERGELNYGELRERVQTHKPKAGLDLTPKLALLVLELADAAMHRTGGISGWVACRPEPGGALTTLQDRKLVETRSGRDGAISLSLLPGAATLAWLKDRGFDEDRQGALYAIRAEAIGMMAAELHDKDRSYVTPWLNTAAAPVVLTPTKPAQPEEDEDEAEDISATLMSEELLVFGEVCHRLWGGNLAACDGYPAGRAIEALIQEFALVSLYQPKGGGWFVKLTPSGEALRDERMALALAADDDLFLAQIQATSARKPNADDVYITPWLNPPRKSPVPAPSERAETEFQRQVRQAAEEEAAAETAARAAAAGGDEGVDRLSFVPSADRIPFMLSAAEADVILRAVNGRAEQAGTIENAIGGQLVERLRVWLGQ